MEARMVGGRSRTRRMWLELRATFSTNTTSWEIMQKRWPKRVSCLEEILAMTKNCGKRSLRRSFRRKFAKETKWGSKSIFGCAGNFPNTPSMTKKKFHSRTTSPQKDLLPKVLLLTMKFRRTLPKIDLARLQTTPISLPPSSLIILPPKPKKISRWLWLAQE